jgi:preprotein translocase subunit SecA
VPAASQELLDRVSSWPVAPPKWKLSHWSQLVPAIGALEEELQQQSDEELRKRSLALRYRAKSREPLTRLMPEAYALVREAGRRKLNMRHFDVQVLGGIALHHRSIAEMQTGEGKTLTATMPLYLNALTGEGVHLATVNDYLAQRDANWMRPIYETLGMSVGVIQSQMPSDQRRKAYACDVTYGTANEFGFDFLRDRLLIRRTLEGQTDIVAQMLGQGAGGESEKPVQRAASFVLVDEADSILIDEARTPLIISALPNDEEKREAELFKWSATAAPNLVEDDHYEYDYEKKTAELTAEGRRMVRSFPRNGWVEQVGMLSLYDSIERAVRADKSFILDRHYVVREGEIVIVDEFTGRMSEGRKWRDGLHQAIEAKENVQVTLATGHAARVTIQDYFLRYPRLAGMTGTAATSARELRKIYKVGVLQIPTHRPPIREQLSDRIFGTEDEKFAAVVQEIVEVRATGRPILVGTRSIDKSEKLSSLLTAADVPHEILNARQIAAEAKIVSEAGQPGHVTVSTNMAGRGTDIRLGEGVAEFGGMHVICTELHDAARIDRQLVGRCGRQGDPGSFRQYLSLDDDILLYGLGPKKAKKLAERGRNSSGPFDDHSTRFRKAQRLIERRYFRDRKALMYHEKERKKVLVQMGQDPYLDSPA